MKIYEKYMDHKKAFRGFTERYKLENKQIALLQEHQRNPASKIEKPR